MKNHLLFLFVVLSMSTHAQYKRFGVGAMAGISNHSFGYEYKSLDMLVQYNFKRTFSIITGVGVETGDFRITDFYEFPQPYHYESAVVDFTNWNVPFMFRATFGKERVFLYLQAGVQGYGAPKAEGDVTRSYSPNSGYPDEHFSKTYNMRVSSKVDAVYGGGLTIALTDNINIFGEFRDNPFEHFTPKSEKDDLLWYSHFKGGRLSFGVSWQFNASAESEYEMKTWYPQIEKNE